MPYRALQDIILNSEVKAGDIITYEQIEGRDPQVLIRLELVEYFVGETPKPTPKTEQPQTQAPALDAEEAAPVVEETGPVKATVERHGVWFQVFANGKKIFNSRKENEAKKFARDFNANL